MLYLKLPLVAGLFSTLYLPGGFPAVKSDVLAATSPISTNCIYLVHFKNGSVAELGSVEKWLARYKSAFGKKGTIRAIGTEETTETNDSSFRLAKLRALELRQHLLRLEYSKYQISTFFYNKTVDVGSVGWLEYCLAPQCFCYDPRLNSGAPDLRNQVEFDPEYPS